MESWMISLGVGVITYISLFVTMKNKVDMHQRELDEQHRTVAGLFKRWDTHGDDIVKLNTQAELSMTQKEVDNKYVSKELFREYEKHIDKRFDRVEDGMVTDTAIKGYELYQGQKDEEARDSVK